MPLALFGPEPGVGADFQFRIQGFGFRFTGAKRGHHRGQEPERNAHDTRVLKREKRGALNQRLLAQAHH